MRRVTRAEAVALTRSQLLDAAAEVFGEKGFAGASLDEIAERAGRTKGAVYSNFASKDDLFIAVLDQWLAASHQALEARLASISDASSLVEALRETTTVWARRSRAEFLLLWEFRLYALRNPEVADRLAKHERLAHEMCERQVQLSIDRIGVKAPLSASRLASILQCLECGMELFHHLDPQAATNNAMGDAMLVMMAAVDKGW
jgi:AcrR family transcriptional regulator